MHKEDTQVLVRPLATFTLAGRELPVIEYRGRPLMFARNVAEVLGYEDLDRLSAFISGKWAPRFREGTDYVRLTGDDLAALKAIDFRTNRAEVDSRAPSVTLLTEAGAQVAAMLSRTKVGDRVRWEIVDTLIPALRKLAAPIPKQIAATPAQQMVALAREGTRIGSVFTVDYLAAELAHARAERKLEAARQREIEQAHRRESDRFFRDERARRKAARKRPTTLW